MRDFYGRLIDGMRAERGKLRSGGDGMDGDGLKGSPPVEETVSFYSGIVTVGADGIANAEFALPSFNGTVRVMAVAWSKNEARPRHERRHRARRGRPHRLCAALPDARRRGPRRSLASQRGRPGRHLQAAKLIDQPRPRRVVAEKDIDLASWRAQIARRPPSSPTTSACAPTTSASPARAASPVSRRLTLDIKPPAGDIKRTTVASLSARAAASSRSRRI